MSSGKRGRCSSSTTVSQTPLAKCALTQDDIPVIVKAVIDALPTSVRSDIPSNKTQSTATDGDEIQIGQSATVRHSTRSSTSRGRGTATARATQTRTASANTNNDDSGGHQSTTEPEVEPSDNSGCRSTPTKTTLVPTVAKPITGTHSQYHLYCIIDKSSWPPIQTLSFHQN